jgi:geranylgeranyl diphosphate synthase type I
VAETTAEVRSAGDAPITADLQASISRALSAFIDEKQAQLASLGADLGPLFDTARQAVAGGKRLRPAFAYWGWRAAGGSASDSGPIITAAAAIELVHASALVHDDVMDGSATRRGRLAAQHEFSSLLRSGVSKQQADRFGFSAAILLGDLLLSWSDELLGRSGFRTNALARGRVYFDRLRCEVVAGQYLDVLAQTSGRSSAADAMRVVRYKSAKYTVERPLQFGAALGKADKSLLATLSSYGVPLGEAFQLRDDVLGVFGQSTLTGKPTGDDIREGKRTLLIARALDKSSRAQRDVLNFHLGRPDLDEEGVAAVQEVLRDTNAASDVETVISELKAAALAALAAAPPADAEVMTALRSLADQATDRLV